MTLPQGMQGIPMTGGIPFFSSSFKPREDAVLLSGASLAMTAAVLESLQKKLSPVTVSGETVSFNLANLERNTFYEFEDEEGKMAMRVTSDGMLEIYEVEES